jgi:hypothetical protein
VPRHEDVGRLQVKVHILISALLPGYINVLAHEGKCRVLLMPQLEYEEDTVKSFQ